MAKKGACPVFQALAWEGADEEDGYWVRIFGRTENGTSIALKTRFEPYFYVRAPSFVTDMHVRRMRLHPDVTHASIVWSKTFTGFTNETLFPFLRLQFSTRKIMKNAQYDLNRLLSASGIRQWNWTLYEGNIDPVLRFMHETGICSTGWIRAEHAVPFFPKETSCELEFVELEWKRCKPEDTEDIAPVVVASYDIETFSFDGSFPKATDPQCPIIQIATTWWRYPDPEPYKREVFVLGKCAPVDGACVQSLSTEAALLTAWASSIQEGDPDVLLSYNGWGFDDGYIYRRIMRHSSALGALACLSRVTIWHVKLETKKLSSAAFGDNTFEILTTHGRIQLDLFQYVKRNHKLQAYGLGVVANQFLGDAKVDLPYKEMFALYERGDPESLRRIAEYCVHDTVLPVRLVQKLHVIPNQVEMAKACWVPLEYLMSRGQQIKVFSLLARVAHEENVRVETVRTNPSNEGYVGATVLQAKSGAYLNDIVTCLDFASLYPSIMRAYNLCHSTLVLDPGYDNIEGVEYKTFEVVSAAKEGEEGTVHRYRFAQSVRGILPRLLEQLAANRKNAKRAMAQASDRGDKNMEAVLNGKQLAFKVTMNSIYGFCGAVKGMLPCVPVSSTTTSIGREMIQLTKEHVLREFPGSEVVYGDSVSKDTPIVLRVDEETVVCTVEDCEHRLCMSDWVRTGYAGKESAEMLRETYAWTEKGWTRVHRVIRHRLHPDKQMYRVTCLGGCVDVTEDHSLVEKRGRVVRPIYLRPGTELCFRWPPRELVELERTEKTQWSRVMGFFFGCGEVALRIEGQNVTCSFECKHASSDVLASFREDCQETFPKYTWCIENDSEDDTKQMLRPEGREHVDLVVRLRDQLYDGKAKIVPYNVLEAEDDAKDAFLSGFFQTNVGQSGHWFVQEHPQVSTMTLMMLLRQVGYETYMEKSVSDRGFVMAWTKNKPVFRNGLVLDVSAIEYSGYVYDLTTENHHFQAGIGGIVVHNTDSVFVKFKKEGDGEEEQMRLAFERGKQAASLVTSEFPKPIELEFEKCYRPFLLFTKKRYVGLMYEADHGPSKPKKLDAKGIQLVRRDNPEFVKRVLQAMIDKLMHERDVRGAVNIVRNEAQNLLDGKVPVEDLVMSKTLRSEYKNGNLPHLSVVNKMREREPGSEPKPGNRVPYVFVETKDPNDLQFKKAEDPVYTKENALVLDVGYYLEHCLVSPTTTILRLFVQDPHEEIFKPYLDFVRTRNKKRTLEHRRIQERQHSLFDFYGRD